MELNQLLTIIIAISLGIVIYLLFSQRRKPDDFGQKFEAFFIQINQRLDSVQKEVGERLRDNVSLMQQSHQHTSKTVMDVQTKLTQLEEATKRIFEVGKDISSLHDILRAPKLRGGIGEYLLGDLLGQYLPQDNFLLQYKFKNGMQVDAVIKLRDFLIPIDSKFPLENFKRILAVKEAEEQTKLRKQFASDVKKHIDDIARKYILPDEGTSDFALMYVPAENVYYEMIIHEIEGKSLADYALKKKVIPTSPNSFWAYLQAILVGLKGQQVQENMKDVIKNLSRLRGDFGRFEESFEVLGSHLQNAQTKYDDSAKRLVGIQTKLERIEAPDQKALEEVKK